MDQDRARHFRHALQQITGSFDALVDDRTIEISGKVDGIPVQFHVDLEPAMPVLRLCIAAAELPHDSEGQCELLKEALLRNGIAPGAHDLRYALDLHENRLLLIVHADAVAALHDPEEIVRLVHDVRSEWQQALCRDEAPARERCLRA